MARTSLRGAVSAALLAAFSAGIVLSTIAPAGGWPCRAAGPACAVLLLAVLAGRPGRRGEAGTRSRCVILAGCASGLFLCGAVCAQASRGECAPFTGATGRALAPSLARARSSGLSRRWDGLPVRVSGWCRRDGVVTPDASEIVVRVETLTIGTHRLDIEGTVRLRVRAVGEEPAPPLPLGGCRVEALGLIRSRWSPGNPGENSREDWLEREGVDLLATIRHPSLLTALDVGEAHPVWHRLALVRRSLSASIAAAWNHPATWARGRLLEAFLLGDVHDLPDGILDAFRRGGLSHIVAISGLQVVLATGLVLTLLRLAGASPRAARAGGLAACLGYGLLAAAEPSVLRAVVATSLVLAARLFARRARPLPLLSLAALCLLVAQPASLGDAGLQLSFAATAGLLTSGRATPHCAPGAGHWLARALGGLLRASVAAWVVTAPIVLFHFQKISFFAIPANLLAVPLGSLIVCLGALFLAGSAAGCPGTGLLAAPIDALLRLLIGLCDLAPRGAPMRIESFPPGAAMTIACLVAIGTSRLAPGPRARAASGAIGCLLLAAVVFGNPFQWSVSASKPALRLDMIDVGQGDGILVSLGSGARLLIDAGPALPGGFDAGERIVVPFLRRRGIERLDAVAVTHPHADHLGGMAAVIRSMRPAEVWLARDDTASAALLRERLDPIPLPPVRWLEAGDRLELSERIAASILMPDERARASKDPNARSLVIRLTCGPAAWLLTGDLDSEGERRLLERGIPLRAGLLKAAHHGSANSSIARFLEAVGPEAALLSAGLGNPWGHPRPEALDRIRAAGAIAFRTDRNGACSFTTDGRLLRGGPLREDGPVLVRRIRPLPVIPPVDAGGEATAPGPG